MASETTKECTDAALTPDVIVSFTNPEDVEVGDICTVSVEIDNALSDDPAMPAILEGQPEFYPPSSTSERESVKEATEQGQGENDQSMEVQVERNNTSMADEEVVSDQSILSEGIIVNSDGVNKVAAFDTEFAQSEAPQAVVKTEPIDPEEDANLNQNENLNLSLTQCALQLQFSDSGGAEGVALVKQEVEAHGKNLNGPASPSKTASFPEKKRKYKKMYQRPGPGRPSNKAKDLTDLCLVCSAPCFITKNRKIPSLPFCKKCKKAYFYQLGHSRKRVPRCSYGGSCIIHFKNGSHCSICHLEKFQRILRSAKAAFRSGSGIEQDKKASKQEINSRAHLSRLKDPSVFVNDAQLIQEAMNSYPLVVLNKMDMDPDETVDTKDLPDVFITSEKRPNPDRTPRMFAMPFDDVVKQEVPFLQSEIEFPGSSVVSPESENKLSPKLGPIKFPFGSTQSKTAASSSNLSLLSPPRQEIKRGRGRPRKTPIPSPDQGQANESCSPEILRSLLNDPHKDPKLKKVEVGDKDIKIFVFECGHACSACNPAASRTWLKQNGYLSVDPSSKKPADIPADPNLYQKFVEFYNAAVNSAPRKRAGKVRQAKEQSPQMFIPVSSPIPLNMIPNSATGSQPQMLLFPPPPPFINKGSPIAVSSPNLNHFPPLPSSMRTKPSNAVPPASTFSNESPLRDQLQGNNQGMVRKPTMMRGPVPSVPTMDAVRLALNSHLMKQDGRMDFMQPARVFLSPQNLPLGLPLQAITPSSSVRQPGAPYFLSPSRDREASSSSSSKPK
ncbi:hypothetical protein ElyMa_000929100 [Elysia marginata]|uniref:Uncharacterized protein n=1 Tax=Elysia marginata TaxID=1093978 RepID=A0AAV4HCS4_9GAST|nr:hypothetical protein ElyMa_000929100 [Elysia marginata]